MQLLSLKKKTKKKLYYFTLSDHGTSNSALSLICETERGIRKIYESFMENNIMPACCKKWEGKVERNVKWENIFMKCKYIKETAMKWFQIKILHRILGTNIILNTMDISMNNLCTFCNKSKENIVHLLYDCDRVKLFWENLCLLINNKCTHAVKFGISQELVIFNTSSTIMIDEVMSYIILSAKQYIYKCKYYKSLLNVKTFLSILTKKYYTLKYIAKLNMNEEIFIQKWTLYNNLLL